MPVTGGYLRTNYRRTGGDLDPTAIGAGILKGSAAGGSNLEGLYWGGFVANSMSAVNTNFQMAPLTDIIYSYWGGGYDSGYRIMPIAIQIRYQSGSLVCNNAWFSISDSTDSTINVILGNTSMTGLASSFSAAIILFGFICSAPG